MTYAFVQTGQNDDSSGTTATTIAVTLGSAFSTGNACVVHAHDGRTTAGNWPTCGDNKGNTYTEVSAARLDDSANNNKLTAFYALALSGSGVPTITLTWAVAQSFREIVASEYSGIAGSSALIGGSGNHQAGVGSGTDNITSGTINFTSQPALLAGYSRDDSGSPLPDAGSAFTSRGSDASAISRWEDARITATGNAEAFFSSTGSANYNTVAIGLLEGNVDAFPGRGFATGTLPLGMIFDPDDGNKGKFDDIDIRGWWG